MPGSGTSFSAFKERGGGDRGASDFSNFKNWNTVCEEAGLSETDRALLMGRQYLNPFAFDVLETVFADITKAANIMRTAQKE